MKTLRVTVTLGGMLLLCLSVSPPCVTAQAGEDAPGAVPEAVTLEALAWMAGHWSSQEEGTVSEELWMPPAGGVMLGLHRDSREDPARAFFEYLRIEQRGETLVYTAQPGGGEATAFTLSHCGEHTVVFTNPEHDFPKQITYWLDDAGRLNASASGTVGDADPGLQWQWQRVEPDDG